jgi:hypothetical protein
MIVAIAKIGIFNRGDGNQSDLAISSQRRSHSLRYRAVGNVAFRANAQDRTGRAGFTMDGNIAEFL